MFKPFLKRMLPNWRWFNEEWMRDFAGPKYVMFYGIDMVSRPFDFLTLKDF
jgi:hypothetical protein